MKRLTKSTYGPGTPMKSYELTLRDGTKRRIQAANYSEATEKARAYSSNPRISDVKVTTLREGGSR